MKRKISIILAMILIMSTLTSVAAEENIPAEISKASAEVIPGKLMLSMDEAVKIAIENSRKMWKIDDGIKQMQDAKKAGKDAKEQAEILMGLSLEAISSKGVDIDNYVDLILAKNGYYVKFAETQTKQMEKSRELLIKGIEIQTKSLYYSVLLSEKAIEINESALLKAEEQLRAVNLKFQSGRSTKAEVLNAEMAVQQAKTALDSSIDDLNISKLNLLNELNLPFDEGVVLTDTELTYASASEIDLNDSIEKAKAERPEVLTALNDLELQEIETHAYTAYYTSNLRQNKAAKEKLKDAELNIPQTYKDVELDVRKSYLNMIKAERSYLNMQKTLELAKESARINKLLYDNGMVTLLDVISAETNLAQAEIGSYQLLAAYNISRLMFGSSDLISGM